MEKIKFNNEFISHTYYYRLNFNHLLKICKAKDYRRIAFLFSTVKHININIHDNLQPIIDKALKVKL